MSLHKGENNNRSSRGLFQFSLILDDICTNFFHDLDPTKDHWDLIIEL